MITFDYDGVLTNDEILKFFNKVREKTTVMVVSSRDESVENKREIRLRVGVGVNISLCGGFVEKCERLANIAGVFGKVIHFDDDPAIVEFFKSTNVNVEVRMIK